MKDELEQVFSIKRCICPSLARVLIEIFFIQSVSYCIERFHCEAMTLRCAQCWYSIEGTKDDKFNQGEAENAHKELVFDKKLAQFAYTGMPKFTNACMAGTPNILRNCANFRYLCYSNPHITH